MTTSRGLIYYLRILDDDVFSEMYQRELDHLGRLTDEKRVEEQRERCQVFAQVAEENSMARKTIEGYLS